MVRGSPDLGLDAFGGMVDAMANMINNFPGFLGDGRHCGGGEMDGEERRGEERRLAGDKEAMETDDVVTRGRRRDESTVGIAYLHGTPLPSEPVATIDGSK